MVWPIILVGRDGSAGILGVAVDQVNDSKTTVKLEVFLGGKTIFGACEARASDGRARE
jgi:hypothetical protein